VAEKLLQLLGQREMAMRIRKNLIIGLAAEKRANEKPNGITLHVLARGIAVAFSFGLILTFLCQSTQAGAKHVLARSASDAAVRTGFEPAPPLVKLSTVSRKAHGSAGEFDIDLPAEEPFGIECRGPSGEHTIVVAFSNELDNGNVAVASGKGSIASTKFSSNEIIIELLNVADAQLLTLSVTQVIDRFGQAFPDFTVTMQTLLGDSNTTGTVNAADITLVKSELGHTVTDSNFLADVNASGEVNSSDISIIKAHSGSGVPITDTLDRVLADVVSEERSQSISFSGPSTVDLGVSTQFTVLVDLTFTGYNSYGLSYWMEVSDALAPFISLTNVTHSVFPDANQSVPNPAPFNSSTGAGPGYATAGRDLGATVQIVDPENAVPPGTHQIASLTFSVDPSAPSGMYTLRSTIVYPYISEVADTDFADNVINPAGTFTFTIVGGVSPTPTPTPTPVSYTISVSASPSAAGTVGGGGNYTSGSAVTVTATANTGYNFVNWTENGNIVSTSANYMFTAFLDRVLVANFVPALPTVATPTISPDGGTFRKKVKVTLRDATAGAKIYFTINGADPTNFSRLYKKPFKIKGLGTYNVKAKAIRPGYNDSAVATATFTIQ
jgi:hypothetical protein